MFKKLESYEKAARVIRLMAWINVMISVLLIMSVLIPIMADPEEQSSRLFISMSFLFLYFFAQAVFMFVTAFGLSKKKESSLKSAQFCSALIFLSPFFGPFVGVYVHVKLRPYRIVGYKFT
jgi:uncharacterized membrane protein